MLTIQNQLENLLAALQIRLQLPAGVVPTGTLVPLEFLGPDGPLTILNVEEPARTMPSQVTESTAALGSRPAGTNPLALPDPNKDFSSITLSDFGGMTLGSSTAIPTQQAEVGQTLEQVFAPLAVNVRVKATATIVDDNGEMKSHGVVLVPSDPKAAPDIGVINPTGVLFEPVLVQPRALQATFVQVTLRLEVSIELPSGVQVRQTRVVEVPLALELLPLPVVGVFFRLPDFAGAQGTDGEATVNAALVFAEPTPGIIPAAWIEDDVGQVSIYRETLLAALQALLASVTPPAPYFPHIADLARALVLLTNTLRSTLHFAAIATHEGRIDLTDVVYVGRAPWAFVFDQDVDAENSLSSAIILGVAGGIRCYTDDNFTGDHFIVTLDASVIPPRLAVAIPRLSDVKGSALLGGEGIEIEKPRAENGVEKRVDFDDTLICLEYVAPDLRERWSDAQRVEDQKSKAPPALASFGGVVHMVHLGDTSNDLWWSKFDGTSWSENEKIPGQKSKASPALAEFGGLLHMVHLGDSSNDIWWSRFDGTNPWTENEKIPGQKSKASPALAAFDGHLHMVHLGDSSNDIWWSRFDGTNPWTENEKIPGQKSKVSPALAVFRGVLHMVHLGDDSNDIWWSTLDSATGTWRPNSKIPGQKSRTAPALAALDNRFLHMVHLGDTSNRLWWSVFGLFWRPNVTLPAHLSKVSPALAAFQNRIIMVHVDARQQVNDLWWSQWPAPTS